MPVSALLLSHIFSRFTFSLSPFHFFLFFFESRNTNLSPLPLMNKAKKNEFKKREKKSASSRSNSRPLSNSDRELSSFQPIPVQAPWRCQHGIRSCLLFNLLITEQGGFKQKKKICRGGILACAPVIVILLKGAVDRVQEDQLCFQKLCIKIRCAIGSRFFSSPRFDPLYEDPPPSNPSLPPCTTITTTTTASLSLLVSSLARSLSSEPHLHHMRRDLIRCST